jgi:hypothetical protein
MNVDGFDLAVAFAGLHLQVSIAVLQYCFWGGGLSLCSELPDWPVPPVQQLSTNKLKQQALSGRQC